MNLIFLFIYLFFLPLVLKVLKKFRDDEMEHHDTGLEHDAEQVCSSALHMPAASVRFS